MSNTQPKGNPATVTKYVDGKPVSTTTIQSGTPMTQAQTKDAAVSKETKPAKPAPEPKVPAESKLVRDATYTKVKDADENVKHHQQKVIMAVLATGKTELKDIVAAIAGDQKLVQEMNTRQPIERCVRYHAKWLTDHGYITTTKAEKPKKEAAAKKEAPAKPAKTEAPSKLAQ